MSTQSTLQTTLKTIYSKEAVEQIANTEAPTFSMLKKAGDDVNLINSQYVFAVDDGLPFGSYAYINELESLPEHQKLEEVTGSVTKVRGATRVMFSGDLIEACEKAKDGLFADQIVKAYDNAMKVQACVQNAALFRDGTGSLAVVNGAVSAGTSIAFDGGIPTHLRENMLVDIYNGATLQAQRVKITGNNNVDTITVASAVTVADNAVIKLSKSGDNAPTNGKEIIGLPMIADDGALAETYEGIRRSGSGTIINGWKGITINANSVNLSDALMRKLLAQKNILASKKNQMKILSNEHQNIKYMITTLPQVQFTSDGKPMNRDTAPAKLTWNGMEWLIDKDCGYGDLYFVDFSQIMIKDETPFSFQKIGNHKGMQAISGYDAYEDYAIWRGAVLTKNPKLAAVRIKNLASDGVVF